MSLICATADNHIYSTRKVTVECADHSFFASQKCIVHDGYKVYIQSFMNYFNIKENNTAAKDESIQMPLGELKNNMFLSQAIGKITEHYTKAPSHYTESMLLSAMEKAGMEDIDDEAERKGLGTPATRADIIEKLVKDKYVSREKKILIPMMFVVLKCQIL